MFRRKLTSRLDLTLAERVVVRVATGVATVAALIKTCLCRSEGGSDLRVLVVKEVGHRDDLVTVAVGDATRAKTGRVVGT